MASKYHADWITDERWFDSEILPDEEWRSISSYQGYEIKPGYFISDVGRVKGPKGKILRFHSDKGGYAYVGLYHVGSAQPLNHPVHRLMGYTFLGDPPRTMINPTIQHKNNIAFDNRLCNIEWMELHDNVIDGNGKRCKIVVNGEEHIFQSQQDASLYLGWSSSYISQKLHANEYICNSNGEFTLLYFEDGNDWIKYDCHSISCCTVEDDNGLSVFPTFEKADIYLGRHIGYIKTQLHGGRKIFNSSGKVVTVKMMN